MSKIDFNVALLMNKYDEQPKELLKLNGNELIIKLKDSMSFRNSKAIYYGHGVEGIAQCPLRYRYYHPIGISNRLNI